ncbi:MAG: vanadium-dependent haloperoxidase [Pyrinomonadaceae bacterium]
MTKERTLKYSLTIAIALIALTNVWAQDIGRPDANVLGEEDVILQWNRVLQQTISTPGQHPPRIFPVRSFAMMHAAMFDAVNSIDGRYTPYIAAIRSYGRRASEKAAAAQAARDVLVALYPTRQAVFDAELADSLQGVSVVGSYYGTLIGRAAAENLLAVRANDGWNLPFPPFTLPATPGNWQPIPPSTGAAFTQVPAVLPFALDSAYQFTSNPPPSLTSDEYARDLNEVKEIGSATSATRTADQTKVAQLWANVNTPTTVWYVWNNVARTVAIQRGNSTAENARLFALLNIAHHDALQTTMTSKFVYGMWRPTTAIRRADEDGNPDTSPDVNWTSLLGVPPYPTYSGNHATIGTSNATILALFFGRDDIRFQHTWEGAGGATRSYPGFNAMADEEERSRVYGGLHFTFDQHAGQSAGRNVANFVFLNLMRPRGHN